MSDFNKELGHRLNMIRRARRLTRKDCAEELSMTVQGYGHIETGRTAPSLEHLCVLCKLFRCTISEACGEDPQAVDALEVAALTLFRLLTTRGKHYALYAIGGINSGETKSALCKDVDL